MEKQDRSTQIWGHPKGLFYLFFAELWERFSFYGMRALLVLYMTDHLLYSDETSFGIFAAYGSLVYVTPLIGGMVADKIIGYKKSIFLGGILMALGHFVLAIEHTLTFYAALSLLIIGNGFFKPNISSFVGSLYSSNDNKRDAGFMIFYMGINIGGWIAPLLCGWLGLTYGWHYGFGLAGIGMLVGLLIFNTAVNGNVFGDRGNVSNQNVYDKKTANIKQGYWIPILSILAIPLISLIIKYNQYEHYLVWIVSICLLVILFNIFKNATKIEKGQLLVIVYFTLLACLFFTIFEQAGSSLTLFAKRNVNLQILNASQTNSLNSAYIVLLAIPFAWLWTFLTKMNKNPNSPFKMGFGLVLVGIGFLVFGYSSHFLDDAAKVPMIFLVIGIFIYTLGELFLSPVGLSKITALSPQKYLSFLMGFWFLASFYGHFFAGKIAQLTTVIEGEESIFTQGVLKHITPIITGLDYATMSSLNTAHMQLYSYVSVFSGIGLFSLCIGIIAVIISPFIKKLMGNVD